MADFSAAPKYSGPYVTTTVPAEQPVQSSGSPAYSWLCHRKLVKGWIGVAIALSVVGAVMSFLSIDILCIISGVILLVIAIVLLIFEFPNICIFVDMTKPVAEFANKRTNRQKGITYMILAFIPTLFCFTAITLLGSVFVFAAGCMYLFLSRHLPTNRHAVPVHYIEPGMSGVSMAPPFSYSSPGMGQMQMAPLTYTSPGMAQMPTAPPLSYPSPGATADLPPPSYESAVLMPQAQTDEMMATAGGVVQGVQTAHGAYAASSDIYDKN